MTRGRIALVTALTTLVVGIFMSMPGSAFADGHSVTISAVSRNGASATVSGVATFAPITAPESVGGVDTDWPVKQELADAAGIDLVDAQIVPLADGSGLRFIWKLSNLPAQIPPEIVRYTWGFKIGSTQYQLQAKRTNIVSSTTAEAPLDHVMQLASGKEFFQLRGACTDHYPVTQSPVAGCYHLGFFPGKFDIANKTVSFDLPYNARDSVGRLVAPDFKPGAVLLENQSAGMSIAAAFQAVVGNTNTSDFINGWNPYFVGPGVQLGVGPAGADLSDPEAVTFTQNATLNPDGTFTGSVSGLTSSNNTVYVRACSGATCAYASVAP